jgi:DNA-binding MarR family transcriptional regulator
MASIKLQNNLYWQLLRFAINAKHSLMTIADKYNLTVMQMYTLCLLEADAAIPMNSLTSMLHCDASNVTGIVDRLFHQKYIKREENPNDRRAKLITLTPKGAKLCEKITEALTVYQPTGLTGLSDTEKKLLLTLLNNTNFQPSHALSSISKH